jgi:hypothetical protein
MATPVGATGSKARCAHNPDTMPKLKKFLRETITFYSYRSGTGAYRLGTPQRLEEKR